MFEKGNFVVNTNNGICEIQDIVTMNMSGSNKEYFLLVPIDEKTAKVYIPIDMAQQRIRLAMSKEDALSSRDPRRLIGIIKTLYLRKQERVEAGKKNTAVDERYFKLAENHLHSELAFALQVDKSEVHRIIVEHITKDTSK